MNKFICKAKRVDNGEWICGHVARLDYLTDELFMILPEFITIRIDQNTVCRPTEMTEFVMTDKLVCTPLFEGDIVEVWSRRRPPGENIVLYRDNTTSKYDVQVKARAVICFKNGQWQLDYNNTYNDSICELKGNEQIERIVEACPLLYSFGYHGDNEDWWRAHNQLYKWADIIKLGNIYDNPELLRRTIHECINKDS